MKIISLFILGVIIFTSTFAQNPANKITEALETRISNTSANEEILIWIYFTDKGDNTDIYFNNPQLVVSQKSIKRREKVLGRSSLLTIKDIPVNNYYIIQTELKGFKLKHQSKWLNAVSGRVFKNRINQLASLSFVKKLDIVYKLKKENPLVTDITKIKQTAPKTQQPAGIHSYNYGDSYDEMQQINVPAVHDLGYTGQGVTICLMDAGFNRLSHTAFNSINIVAEWDFVNNDPNVGNQADSGDGSHGTMTLSTIGGFSPGNLIGPAFGADYILAKTENTESETPIEEDNWVSAMEWADSIGVDVTSTSLSYIDFDPPWPSYTWMDMDGNTTIITKAADYATHLGIVVVNSAGNEGFNPTHNTLGAPADGDSVISTGAVNYSGERVSFSSVGPTVDGRIKPDVMALGANNIVASSYDDNSFVYASGTSFSCPLSAGVAALVLCANPTLTPMQVRDAMRNTSSQSSNPDNLNGWGILNAFDAINYFPGTDTTTFQLAVDIANGWNMVSVPGINPDGQGVNNWWPDLTGNVYRFISGGYNIITSTTPTEGYWIKNIEDETYTYNGLLKIPHEPINISGWSMFGVYECPVIVNELATIPPGLNIGIIYRYFNGYQMVDTLYPGYGYWIKLNGQLILPPCNNTMHSSKVNEIVNQNFGKIIITDKAGKCYTLYAIKAETDLDLYELPPYPPDGMFDIRFSTGRIAEDINSSFKTIEMRGILYPITVRTDGIEIKAQDITGNGVNVEIKQGEEIKISKLESDKLIVSGVLIPDKFSLEQNYPNPFNPNTIIKFSVPDNVRNVTVSIYNLLGQKVAELVNSELAVGKYEYQWDAKDFASGVYIYQLKTDNYISVKKMLLIK
jgi:serine protease AprX